MGKAWKKGSRFEERRENRAIWFTWETQIRNQELARSFSAELLELDYSSDNQISRYLRCSWQTLKTLYSWQPKLVFAQNPSVALCFLLCILKPAFGYRLVIDAHTIALRQLSSGGLVSLITAYLFRTANRVIVSNTDQLTSVTQAGGIPLPLPDRMPEVHASGGAKKERSDVILTLICSFQPDEPIELFLQAATQVEHQFKLYVTGRKRNAGAALRFSSERIIFTDFLPREEYNRQIADSDLLIDLTTLESCLVCGAYEAAAVSVPAIISDSPASRQIFSKGYLYASNDIESYRRALDQFFQNRKRLKAQIAEFHAEFPATWENYFNSAKASIEHC